MFIILTNQRITIGLIKHSTREHVNLLIDLTMK